MATPATPYDAAHLMLTTAGISHNAADTLLRDVPADGLTTLAVMVGALSDPVAYLGSLDSYALAEILHVPDHRGTATLFAQTCRAATS